MKLNEYLKRSRKKVGLSQRQVAVRTGYASPQFVSNIERGKCSPPDSMLKALVRLYGLKPSRVLSILVQTEKERLRALLGL